MRFAVNYSTKLAELVMAGKVDFDLFKCPEWEGCSRLLHQSKPVYLHLDITIGRDRVQRLDYAKLRRMLAETNTPHVNCHLSGSADLKIGNKTDRLHVAKRWIDESTCSNENSGLYRHLENLPFEPPIPEYHLASDPKLITEAILETDTGLLLDISHARISADTLGVDYREYIESPPLERLHEILLACAHTTATWRIILKCKRATGAQRNGLQTRLPRHGASRKLSRLSTAGWGNGSVGARDLGAGRTSAKAEQNCLEKTDNQSEQLFLGKVRTTNCFATS